MSRRRRGAQAVEFALAAVPLTLILAATIDFGLYFRASQVVVQATVAGTHAGHRTTDGVEQTAMSACQLVLEASNMTGTCSANLVNHQLGVSLQVQASTDYQPLFQGWGFAPSTSSYELIGPHPNIDTLP